MGVLYEKRERERAREGHVSVLSCALLSPLRPDTPRMHAIIIELSAIIRCHFCPSEVFLSGTPVSFSTHSCQSFRWQPRDLSNNIESSQCDSPWVYNEWLPSNARRQYSCGGDIHGFHSQEYSA